MRAALIVLAACGSPSPKAAPDGGTPDAAIDAAVPADGKASACASTFVPEQTF